MMKKISLAFLMLFCIEINAQNKIISGFGSCKDGTERAVNDIKKGKLKLLSYGLIDRKDYEYYEFFNEYALNKYNVILGDGGCIVTEESKCYSKKMKAKILEKFGDSFFDKLKVEVKQEYPKSEYFKKNVSPRIENDEIIHAEKAAYYLNNDLTHFKNYVEERLTKKNKYPSSVRVSFIVEKNGSLSNIDIVSGRYKNLFKEELVDILSNMPKWTPAEHFGYIVRTKRYQSFKLK